MSSMQASMQASMQSMQATAAISAATSAASLAASSAATSAATCAQTMSMRMNMDMMKEFKDMKQDDDDDENSESSAGGDPPPAPPKADEKKGVWAEPAASTISAGARKVHETTEDDRTSVARRSADEYDEYTDSDPYSYGNSDDEPETQVPHPVKAYKAPVVKTPLLPQTAKQPPIAPPPTMQRAQAQRAQPQQQETHSSSSNMHCGRLPQQQLPPPKHRRTRSPAPSRARSPKQQGCTSKSVARSPKRFRGTEIAANSKGTGSQRYA